MTLIYNSRNYIGFIAQANVVARPIYIYNSRNYIGFIAKRHKHE